MRNNGSGSVINYMSLKYFYWVQYLVTGTQFFAYCSGNVTAELVSPGISATQRMLKLLIKRPDPLFPQN